MVLFLWSLSLPPTFSTSVKGQFKSPPSKMLSVLLRRMGSSDFVKKVNLLVLAIGSININQTQIILINIYVATRKRPFLSTVFSRKSTFREGLNNIITPLLCLKPCANRISPPHSARHTSSPSQDRHRFLVKKLYQIYSDGATERASSVDLLRPLIFSATALRQLVSLRIHFGFTMMCSTLCKQLCFSILPLFSVELGRGKSSYKGRVYDVTHCYNPGKSAFLHINYAPSRCLVIVQSLPSCILIRYRFTNERLSTTVVTIGLPRLVR